MKKKYLCDHQNICIYAQKAQNEREWPKRKAVYLSSLLFNISVNSFWKARKARVRDLASFQADIAQPSSTVKNDVNTYINAKDKCWRGQSRLVVL